MNNERVRKVILDNKLYQWQVADLLGIDEGLLSRKLNRKEMEDEEQDIIIEAINSKDSSLYFKYRIKKKYEKKIEKYNRIARELKLLTSEYQLQGKVNE